MKRRCINLWLGILMISLVSCQSYSASTARDSVDVVLQPCRDGTRCSDVSWSPDSSEVVFEMDLGDQYGYGPLMIATSDFSEFHSLIEPVRDADTELEYDDPVWSPQGDKIAFYTHNRQNGEDSLNVIDANGQNLKQVIALPYGKAGSGLSWSPDGQQVLYSRKDEQGREWIAIADQDGSHERLIEEITDLWQVAWSPDGRNIAFVAGWDNPDVYVMNTDGTGLLNLTNDGGVISEYQLAWSPDSQRLLIATRAILFVINVDGTGRELLPYRDYEWASISWSPDGQWVIASVHMPNTATRAAQLVGDRLQYTILVRFKMDY